METIIKPSLESQSNLDQEKRIFVLVSQPLMVRLKQPSLSPDSESAPHWRTTALGWYISITLAMIYTNNTNTITNVSLQKCQSAKVNNSFFTHRLKYGFIGLIVNPIPQRVIHSVIFALSSSDVLQITKQISTGCITTLTFWNVFIKDLPWGHRCQGSTLHTCGRTRSWHGLWCRKPLPHHLRDGCQYLCTELSGGIWK